MIQAMCYKKNRDEKGNIINYVLQDVNGKFTTATGDQIKQAINSGQLFVVNMQIDKAGRLMDRNINSENYSEDIKNYYRLFPDNLKADVTALHVVKKAFDMIMRDLNKQTNHTNKVINNKENQLYFYILQELKDRNSFNLAKTYTQIDDYLLILKESGVERKRHKLKGTIFEDVMTDPQLLSIDCWLSRPK